MVWVDYKKAFDMVLYLWIISSMVMVGLVNNIAGFIKQGVTKLKTKLYADGKLLGSVSIRREKFQGDLYSSLLFVITSLPMKHMLRKSGIGYQLKKNVAKVDHFFMD